MTSPARRVPGKMGRLPYNPDKDNIKLGTEHFPLLAANRGKHAFQVPRTLDNLAPLLSSPGGMPMYDNDRFGDCVWAMAGHAIQLYTLLGARHEISPETAELIKGYSDVTGFDPSQTQPDGSNPTDQGTNIQDMLEYWRKTGIELPNGDMDKIVAFAELPDVKNRDLIAEAIDVFGCVLLGVNLPEEAQEQFSEHEPWSVVRGDQIEGGHAVLGGAFYFSGKHLITHVATWAASQEVEDSWWQRYVEEAWVVVTKDWFGTDGYSPEKFNYQALSEQFEELTHSKIFQGEQPEPNYSRGDSPAYDDGQPRPQDVSRLKTAYDEWMAGNPRGDNNNTFAEAVREFLGEAS